MLLSTVWLGIIGFIDDYLKLRAKRIAKEKGIDYKKTDSDGLAGRFKIFGQVVLGIIVGATLYFNSKCNGGTGNNFKRQVLITMQRGEQKDE